MEHMYERKKKGEQIQELGDKVDDMQAKMTERKASEQVEGEVEEEDLQKLGDLNVEHMHERNKKGKRIQQEGEDKVFAMEAKMTERKSREHFREWLSSKRVEGEVEEDIQKLKDLNVEHMHEWKKKGEQIQELEEEKVLDMKAKMTKRKARDQVEGEVEEEDLQKLRDLNVEHLQEWEKKGKQIQELGDTVDDMEAKMTERKASEQVEGDFEEEDLEKLKSLRFQHMQDLHQMVEEMEREIEAEGGLQKLKSLHLEHMHERHEKVKQLRVRVHAWIHLDSHFPLLLQELEEKVHELEASIMMTGTVPIDNAAESRSETFETLALVLEQPEPEPVPEQEQEQEQVQEQEQEQEQETPQDPEKYEWTEEDQEKQRHFFSSATSVTGLAGGDCGSRV